MVSIDFSVYVYEYRIQTVNESQLVCTDHGCRSDNHRPRTFMLPNTKTLSPRSPTRWDSHCLLVLQFPISLQSEVRLSARFDGVKLELLRNLSRSAPKRVRNFFLSPAAPPRTHVIQSV